MVTARERRPWEWEPWETRRVKAPPGPSLEVREARADAHLLLYVARERLRRGEVPSDLVPRLEAAACDARLTARRQRMAAQLLVRVRMATLAATRARRGT